MFALVQAVIAVDELKQAALGLTGEPLLVTVPPPEGFVYSHAEPLQCIYPAVVGAAIA
jgi:hypothetical protein